jgi:GT2 family glycosyltransferase
MPGDAGIVLLNYNLPFETDALVARLVEIIKYPTEIIVLDNASDRRPPARFTNATALENGRTGGGNLIGAHLLANRHPKVEFFFFLHNDMRFEQDGCPITPLVAALEAHPDAAGVHPVIRCGVRLGDVELTPSGTAGVRVTPRNRQGRIVLDDICPVLLRKHDYFDVGGFDPRLTRCYGAGLDLYNRLAERGREILICDDVEVFHEGQYTYANDVGDETYASCDQHAQHEMDIVFTEKYGPDWRAEFAKPALLAA